MSFVNKNEVIHPDLSGEFMDEGLAQSKLRTSPFQIYNLGNR